MNRKKIMSLTLLLALATLSGCAYRYYLGMHGPTIKNYPEIHIDSIRDDAQCLACHKPDNAENAPPTNHPGFKGCLKCHNDPLK